MPLTPADMRNKQFSTTRYRPGYNQQDIDAFLRRIEDQLDMLIQENEGLRGGNIPQPARHMSPADVRNKQFSATRFRPGYDAREVDTFLSEVEAEIGRLIRENDGLRARPESRF